MMEEKLIIKPKRAKGDDGYRVFSIRVKEELIKEIDDISNQTGRSRNEIICLFMEYALGRCEIGEPEGYSSTNECNPRTP